VWPSSLARTLGHLYCRFTSTLPFMHLFPLRLLICILHCRLDLSSHAWSGTRKPQLICTNIFLTHSVVTKNLSVFLPIVKGRSSVGGNREWFLLETTSGGAFTHGRACFAVRPGCSGLQSFWAYVSLKPSLVLALPLCCKEVQWHPGLH